ncbi:MAG: ABC transporter permease [Myxococcota bacterium]
MTRGLTLTGVAILITVVLAAIVGPFLGYDVIADVDASSALQGPSSTHWLGTDHAGRDVAWRLLLACGPFVGPGLVACGVCVSFGLPLGALAGRVGGPVASAVRFAFTIVEALPRFVLVLLALAIYGNDWWVLAISAGVAYAPTLGEAVFERMEGLRSAEYLTANRAHGVPEWRLLTVHLLWAGCRRLILRHLLGLFAFFLVLETTLSYLDFGVQQPNPSWGNMLAFDLDYADATVWVILAPGAAIWAVLAATTWVRAGLSDEHNDG